MFGPRLVNYDAFSIDAVHWKGNPMPPCFVNRAECGGHVLGADDNARDELARLLVGGRYTLGTALLAALLSLAIAVILAVASRRGGPSVSFVVTTVTDALSALPMWPALLSLCVLAAVWSNHFGAPSWLFVAVAFAFISWPRLVARSEKRDVLVTATLEQWRNAILIVSTVDFFGFGIQPPYPSWGNMLSNAEADAQDMWWAFVFPGLCIFLSVLLIGIARRIVRPRSAA